MPAQVWNVKVIVSARVGVGAQPFRQIKQLAASRDIPEQLPMELQKSRVICQGRMEKWESGQAECALNLLKALAGLRVGLLFGDEPQTVSLPPWHSLVDEVGTRESCDI